MKNKILKSPKVQLIAALVLLALVGIVSDGDLKKLAVFLFSVLTCLFTELIFVGKPNSQKIQSSLITGMIIGLLAIPAYDFWFVYVAGIIAIASKWIIRISKQHIFNPAACGLVIAGYFFIDQVIWWGGSAPIVLIVAVGLILLNIKRLAMPFAYFGTRVLLSFLLGISLESALLLPNLFFAFVMLVEPKTSPSRQIEQWIFGVGCGVLSTVLFSFTQGFDADLVALLMMNLLLFIYRQRKSNYDNIHADYY